VTGENAAPRRSRDGEKGAMEREVPAGQRSEMWSWLTMSRDPGRDGGKCRDVGVYASAGRLAVSTKRKL
jgi:hypothetical protein